MEKFALSMLARKEVEEAGVMSICSADLWPRFQFLLLEE